MSKTNEVFQINSFQEGKTYLQFSFLMIFLSIPFLVEKWAMFPELFNLVTGKQFYGLFFILLGFVCFTWKTCGSVVEGNVKCSFFFKAYSFSFSEIVLAYNVLTFSVIISYVMSYELVLLREGSLETGVIVVGLILFVILRLFFTRAGLRATNIEYSFLDYFKFLGVFTLIDCLHFGITIFLCFYL